MICIRGVFCSPCIYPLSSLLQVFSYVNLQGLAVFCNSYCATFYIRDRSGLQTGQLSTHSLCLYNHAQAEVQESPWKRLCLNGSICDLHRCSAMGTNTVTYNAFGLDADDSLDGPSPLWLEEENICFILKLFETVMLQTKKQVSTGATVYLKFDQAQRCQSCLGFCYT